jgi:hypothetical protein
MSELDRLLKKSMKQLRQIAKEKKIPYYTDYNKEELIKVMYPELAEIETKVTPKKKPAMKRVATEKFVKKIVKKFNKPKEMYNVTIRYIVETDSDEQEAPEYKHIKDKHTVVGNLNKVRDYVKLIHI